MLFPRPARRPGCHPAVLATSAAHRLRRRPRPRPSTEGRWPPGSSPALSQLARSPGGARCLRCPARPCIPAPVARRRLRLGLLIGADHVLIRSQPANTSSAGHTSSGPARPSRRNRGRGKIQERCCHGLMASASNQRTVDPDRFLVMPRETASLVGSKHDQRDNGRSCSAGKEHASGVTSAPTVAANTGGRPERGRSAGPSCPPRRPGCARSRRCRRACPGPGRSGRCGDRPRQPTRSRPAARRATVPYVREPACRAPWPIAVARLTR